MQGKMMHFDQKQNPSQKTRIIWIDTLRGISLISMVLFHGMWNEVFLYGLWAPWYTSTPGYIWQQSICWSFILISGISWNFGKAPGKRGLVVFACGIVVSIVTFFMGEQVFILFGILTFIGSAMLLMILVEKVVKNIPYLWGILIFGILFFISRNINVGTWGFEGFAMGSVPSIWYANYGTAYLGFPPAYFASADYFSLFPWFFLFVVGYFMGKPIQEVWSKKDTKVLVHKSKKARGAFLSNPIAWIGKHALWVYMLHQPFLYGMMWIVHT